MATSQFRVYITMYVYVLYVYVYVYIHCVYIYIYILYLYNWIVSPKHQRITGIILKRNSRCQMFLGKASVCARSRLTSHFLPSSCRFLIQLIMCLNSQRSSIFNGSYSFSHFASEAMIMGGRVIQLRQFSAKTVSDCDCFLMDSWLNKDKVSFF